MRRVRSHGGNRCRLCGATRELGARGGKDVSLGLDSWVLLCRSCYEELAASDDPGYGMHEEQVSPPLAEAVAPPEGEHPTIEGEHPTIEGEYAPLENGTPSSSEQKHWVVRYEENAGGWRPWVYGGAPAPWQH